MAWRVLAGGSMVEISLGKSPSGQERTRTAILGEGALIREELSESMVERYDNNDETLRQQVERVSITVDEETGEEVVTPVGAPSPSSAEAPADSAAATERAEAAEKEAAELRSQVSALQGELDTSQSRVAELEPAVAEAQGQVQELQGQVDSSLSYNDLSKAALEAEVADQDLTVTRADGKEGDPLKSDLVNALEGARSSS